MPKPQSQTFSAGRQNVGKKTDVAVTAQLRPPETLPNPDEISRRIAELWPHGTADERALRDALEVATLLRMAVDQHGYNGDRYDHFAEQRGINHADAYLLYRLGEYADRVIQEHAAADVWPHWREVCRALGLSKAKNDRTAALRQDRDALAARVAELEAEALRQQQESRDKEPADRYWITPDETHAVVREEIGPDYHDPFPHPCPEDYDALASEWPDPSYINASFIAAHEKKGRGLTAVAHYAIGQAQRGITVGMVSPVPYLVNLLLEAGATVRSLGRPRWLHADTGEPMPNPVPCALFVLRRPPRAANDNHPREERDAEIHEP